MDTSLANARLSAYRNIAQLPRPKAPLDQGPQTTFPTTFRVGRKQTNGPFVTISQIKGHLALLNAFVKLKQTVMECQDTNSHMPSNAERRWIWFVNLSTERQVQSLRKVCLVLINVRFDRWVKTLQPEDKALPIEDVLPPVDILMVRYTQRLSLLT
jgi:hypothetical protein